MEFSIDHCEYLVITPPIGDSFNDGPLSMGYIELEKLAMAEIFA
jgi:hypothetical protein